MICPNQLRVLRAKHWWATTDECITSTRSGFDWRLVFLYRRNTDRLFYPSEQLIQVTGFKKVMLTTMTDLACSQNWKSPYRTDFLPCTYKHLLFNKLAVLRSCCCMTDIIFCISDILGHSFQCTVVDKTNGTLALFRRSELFVIWSLKEAFF